MKRYAGLALVLSIAGLTTGCVSRQYVITSEPPGAIVYRNGQPIGATPVEEHFVYYGKYHFRLVKDGYETLEDTPDLCAPWYEYPGIDFVSENINPWKIRDIHRLHYQLTPLAKVRPDEVRARANELRERGKAIQPKPAAPKPVLPPRRPPAGGTVVPPPVTSARPGDLFPTSKPRETQLPAQLVPNLGPDVPAPQAGQGASQGGVQGGPGILPDNRRQGSSTPPVLGTPRPGNLQGGTQEGQGPTSGAPGILPDTTRPSNVPPTLGAPVQEGQALPSPPSPRSGAPIRELP